MIIFKEIGVLPADMSADILSINCIVMPHCRSLFQILLTFVLLTNPFVANEAAVFELT